MSVEAFGCCRDEPSPGAGMTTPSAGLSLLLPLPLLLLPPLPSLIGVAVSFGAIPVTGWGHVSGWMTPCSSAAFIASS